MNRTLAMLVALAVLLAAAPASAQLVRAFTPRFSTNANGDVTLIGNTLMTCSGGGSCTNGRNGTGGSIDNNDFTMVYVNTDTDASTFSSSSATLNLPAGATVLWAGLYWGGDSNNGARNTVRFATPAAGYATLTATQLDGSATDYQGFVDVTTRVRTGGNGTYWTANVYSTPNSSNRHAGWALVVVYGLASAPVRNLVAFDGYGQVTTTTGFTIPVSGFVTPPAGVVNSRLGVVAYEGDLGLTGDNFILNGFVLTNARNPNNNFFNSTVSVLGSHFTAKNPNYVNQLGFDADLILTNGILGNGATSATIQLTTGGDQYYPGVVVFATDLYAPVFNSAGFTKTVSDLNGAPVRAGDVLEYTVTMNNTGQDHAVQCVMRDTLPANATYVPGSLQVVSGPNAGAKTDGAADDQMEYAATSRSVVARLGTGANATSGGQISIATATSVRFRVTVNPPATTGTVISNQGWLAFNAAQSGQSFVAKSDGDAVTPGEQPTTVTTVSTGVAVAGVVYADTDHDALRDGGEAGTGATLYVKLVAPAAATASQAAAADPVTGAFTFGTVTAGTWDLVLDTNNALGDVTPTPPAGWIGTEAATGWRAGLLVGTTSPASQEFGLWHGSRLDGRVFRDDGAGGGTPNDGVAQAGEAGTSGARMRLAAASCAGGVCDSVDSDGAGAWTLWLPFAAAGGAASVVEVNPAGWLSTGGNAGTTGGAYARGADAVTFTAAAGVTYGGLRFGDVPPNRLLAPQVQSVAPGAVAGYAHTFTAGSAGLVTFGVTQAPSPAMPGWGVQLVRDLDCDGAVDAGEPVFAAPLAVAAGQTLCLVLRHAAPAGAPGGAREVATLSASFVYTGASPALSAAQALDDVTSVVAPGGGLVLQKSADRTDARPGDLITYTIAYTNLGSAPVSAIVIHDATPAYTTFASAACSVLGGGLTGCSLSASPAVGGTGAVQWALAGALAPGASGSVSFVVRVQ